MARRTPHLASLLEDSLNEIGCSVDVGSNARDVWRMLLECPYDALILDASLFVEPADQRVLKMISRSDQTPVLMIPAPQAADVSVCAPLETSESLCFDSAAFNHLLAQVRALVRSANSKLLEGTTMLSIGDLRMNMVTRQVTRAGSRVSLTSKEFNLLKALMVRDGVPVTRTELAEELWHVNYEVRSNAVAVTVRRLRAKIDIPFDLPLLHTIRGVGYVLEVR